MEKVIIKTCEPKEYNNKTFYNISLEDGRTGSSSDNLTEFIGQEKELEIKEGKLYNNVQQYYINLPKTQPQAKGNFPQKDYTFEKRKCALECAVLHSKENTNIANGEVLTIAEMFYQFLLKK